MRQNIHFVLLANPVWNRVFGGKNGLRQPGRFAKAVPQVPFLPQFPSDPADPIIRTVRKPTLSEKEIMRTNKIKLTLIIASLCGTGSSINALGQEFNSGPGSSVGRIGDGGIPESAMALGDQDAHPAAFRSDAVTDNASHVGDAARPVSYSAGSYSDLGTSYSGACGSTPCGTSNCNSGCSNISMGWFESETLLWWAKGMGGGPLVLGGNPATAIPTNPLAGGNGNEIGNDLRVGMRINLGAWTDNCQNFGVGARAWGLFTDGSNQTYANGGNSTGVPFFNASTLSTPNAAFPVPGPDVYLVNVSAGANGSNAGTITVRDDLDLIAGEIYGRSLLVRDGKSRVDLLTGYTFTRLDSELGLSTQFADGITNGIQNGTVFTTQDTFGTKNQFHGGHLGLLQETTKGRFAFSMMGKVALGNVRQSSTISGQNSVIDANNSTEPGGIFSQRSNIGTITRDRFTFLPEVNAKMKYKLGNAQLGIGYSLLVFPSVAIAGDQINRTVDWANRNLPNNPTAPTPGLVTNTFFLHGLDLGLTYSF